MLLAAAAARGARAGDGKSGQQARQRARRRARGTAAGARRPAPSRRPRPPCPGLAIPRPGGRARSGPRPGAGHPQCRPPGRQARGNRASTSRRRPPPRLAGWRRHRLLVLGRRCRRCCNPGRTLLHFPVGHAQGGPLRQPRRAAPHPRPGPGAEQAWWRERRSRVGFAGCHCSGWQRGRRPRSGRAKRVARVAEGDPGACWAPLAEFASGRDPLRSCLPHCNRPSHWHCEYNTDMESQTHCGVQVFFAPNCFLFSFYRIVH
ncbi:translation initiation factor IF-2-like isoform X2 [Mustela putorius furo]|uniref:Translation initiation factor IF-2-like isoform X2 n=1 Tax=Mustela putorius furo TaxID=9669 RepID=A0A8U0V4E4_MUSPF|nr:translation initiation factor IF-2-like isoform X2 [Mustela putorius furo]